MLASADAAHSDGWKYLREQAKAGNLSYGWGRSAIPGVQTIEATCFNSGGPLGTVWYSQADNESIYIVQMFVPEQLRGVGIARFLLNTLWDTHQGYGRMVTGGVTRFSIGLLRSLGFNKTKAGWECRRKDRK